MANTQYRFPFLDLGELVQNYKQQLPEIGLTEADFKIPKVERWQTIYTMLLELITYVSPEQLMQHNFETTAHIEHPELFEDSMPLFKLCRYMQKIMCACDIDDFSMGDLTDPNCRRLQRNMSAILNFLYFRTDRLDCYEAIKEETSAQLKMRDAMIKNNMETRAEINRIRSERAEQEPRNAELQSKIEELQHYMERMGDVTMQKKKALHDTNERIAEKRSKLAEMKAKLAEAKEQGARLSRQIVSSPDRLRVNMERMGRQLEQLRVVKEERRARLLELQQMKENLAQIETNCEQALDLVNKIKAEVEQQKEQRRQIQAMRDRVIEKRDELQDLEAREQQVQRMIATKQEKFSKINLTQNNKKQSLENAVQLLRDEKEIIRTQQTEDAVHKDAMAYSQREIEMEEQNDTIKHEKLMASMQENYTGLLEKLEIYHRNLMASRQKLCDAMEL